jgi:hypothetical protein
MRRLVPHSHSQLTIKQFYIPKNVYNTQKETHHKRNRRASSDFR